MLETEPDGIKSGDTIIVPHLPNMGYGRIVRATGKYQEGNSASYQG
jgi:hypothetical protein